jgi:hypothetical protein
VKVPTVPRTRTVLVRKVMIIVGLKIQDEATLLSVTTGQSYTGASAANLGV